MKMSRRAPVVTGVEYRVYEYLRIPTMGLYSGPMACMVDVDSFGAARTDVLRCLIMSLSKGLWFFFEGV